MSGLRPDEVERIMRAELSAIRSGRLTYAPFLDQFGPSVGVRPLDSRIIISDGPQQPVVELLLSPDARAARAKLVRP